jgi:alpha-tubulin suppressor-like RCC1 family protein
MKTKSWLLLATCLLTGLAGLGFTPNGEGWKVTETGPNHQKWSRVTCTTNEAGARVLKTNSIVTLATGMNRLENGKWVESKPHIIPTTNGALCAGAGHQVMLAPNLNTRAAVQIRTPKTNWIQGNVLGLAYTDNAKNKSVLIAQVQDSYGMIIDSNHVIYANAFNGVKADVRYTYTKAGFEQDVILREQPPAPEAYGLSSDTAQLVVITEFLDTPKPKAVKFRSPEEVIAQRGLKNFKIRHSAAETNWLQSTNVDQLMDFNGMKLGFGKAFETGGATNTPVLVNSANVQRHWQEQGNRSFLVEQVKLKDVQDDVKKLPKVSQAGKPMPQGLRNRVMDQLPLPETLLARAEKKPMLLAANTRAETPGLVLDYNLVGGYAVTNSYADDFVFDYYTTYVIAGYCEFSGTTLFYPGAVIKYEIFTSPDGGDASVCTLGPTYFDGGDRVYFTSTEDNTVGDWTDTTGNYIGVYYNGYSYNEANWPPYMALYKKALVMYGYAEIRNVEVRYAGIGISFEGQDGQYFYNHVFNSGFVDCGYAISVDDWNVQVEVDNSVFYTSDYTPKWLWPDVSVCSDWQDYLFDSTPFRTPDPYSCWVYGYSLIFDMCQTAGFDTYNHPGFCDGGSSYNFRGWDGYWYYFMLLNGNYIPDFCVGYWQASSIVPPMSPVINSQPVSLTSYLGGTVTFSVAAAGSQPLNYQWTFNNNAIPGATGATLTLSNVQRTNAGNYAVNVSNQYGSVNSSVATLTVIDPAIVSQPASQTVNGGQNVTFNVVAAGTSPLNYIWFKGGVPLTDGGNISGSKSATLTLSNVTGGSGGSYFVIITNGYGSVTSSVASLTVIDPAIVTQPASQTVNCGQNTTISVVAVGTPPLSYRWFKGGVPLTDGGNLSGSTSATLTLNNVFGGNNGVYSVVITNAYGSVTSSTANLIVNDPVITTQPVTQTVNAGQNATFSIVATGTSPLCYQWRFNGTNIVNATNSTLTLSNVQFSQMGSYSAVVSNVFGSVTSSKALLVGVNGLLGWWKGDGNALDVVGGNNATMYSASYTAGVVGQAFSFNGNYGWVNVPDQPVYALTNSLSIEGWIRPRGNGYAIFWRGDHRPGLDPYFLSMGGNNILSFTVARADNTSVSVSTPIIYNQWIYVAATLDGATGTMSLYTNGILAAQIITSYRPFGALLSDQWPGIGIGNVNDGGNNFPFYGEIDEIALYNRPLSQAEIQGIYNSGSAGKCAPTIITQPASLTNLVGTTAIINVAVNGTQPVSYQWSFNGIPISGATNATLSLNNVQVSQAGNYSVLASNAYGSVASTSANLTVAVPPTIVSQPASQVANAGQSVTFSINATGSAPLFYQWYKDGMVLTSATNASLTISNVQPVNIGNYWAVVSENYGNGIISSATSSAASLSIANVYSGLWQGLVAYYPFNGNANDASGNGKNGVNNGATLTMDRFGAASSAYAFNRTTYISLDTNRPLTGLHTNFTISLWFRANDTSGGDLYQHAGPNRYIGFTWSRGTPVQPGVVEWDIWDHSGTYHAALSSTLPTNAWIHCVGTYDGQTQRLFINGVQVSSALWSAPVNWDDAFQAEGIGGFSSDSGTYRLNGNIDDIRVYGCTLSPSDVAQLYASEATQPPAITSQPASQTVNVGQSVTFSVSATGTQPLNYQWSLNGNVVSGATNATLLLNNVQTNIGGNYSVVVTNNSGSVTSSVASLGVIVIPAVSITYPLNNSVFPASQTNLTIQAVANDTAGQISVQIFQGATSLGVITNPPYTVVWSNVTPGNYALTAVATDNGLVATSAVVNVTISNTPPAITILTPASNAVCQAVANIAMTVTASDANGYVAKVGYYYAGTNLIGESTISPFSMVWSNVAAGTYSLTAKATDDGGAMTTSSPVSVAVNGQPTVSITNPVSNATFAAPTNITIYATASDSDGTISRIDFYYGLNNFIGSVTSAPYVFTLSNVPSGYYPLTALAFDNQGGTAASLPVYVSVSSNMTDIADAHVRGGNQANNNFGTSTNVEVQNSTANNSRVGFFKFIIPTGMSNVSSVKFRFNAKLSAAGAVAATLYTSATNWIESGVGGITWNSSPLLGSALSSTTVNSTMYNWYELDVSSYVLAQLAAGSNTVSLALTNPASSSVTIQINSREAGVNPPILAFTFTNYLPSVTIASPVNGSFFDPGSSIQLLAQAVAPGGTVTNVEFFSGQTSLGFTTNAPYSMSWSTVQSGNYNITAKAADNHGLMATSSVVVVKVDASPLVSITSPQNGDMFTPPTNIIINVNATDADGTIVGVDFYDGMNKLGTIATAPYSLVWSNVPGGNHILHAAATDNSGRTTTSSDVSINVYSTPVILTQPTNFLTFIGDTANFNVSATGSGSLNYQWRFNGTNIAGQNGTTLTLPNAQRSDQGNYDVIVSNPYGAITSAPVSLVLTVIATWGNMKVLYPWMTNNIVSISSGANFDAALKSDGTVVTWGQDIGAQPSGLSGVIAISCGTFHVLALKADHTVVAWGDNSSGECNVPVGLTNVVAVAGGYYYSMALKADGTVVDWGTGLSGTPGTIPAGLNNVKAISVSPSDVMVLQSNGTVVVWGDNCCGQTNVPNGLVATAIACGNNFCMALQSDGSIAAWGYSTYGSLNIPWDNYKAIAAGWRHSIAIRNNGTVGAWGGQPMYLPPPFTSPDPPYLGQCDVPAGLANVVGISGGDSHTIALIANDGHLAPSVSIISPTNYASLPAATNIAVTATASSSQGTVAKVDLYLNGNLVGSDSMSPYSFVVTNAVFGLNTLVARATDDLGYTKDSLPLTISITATVSANADAHVKQVAPTSNFGAATTMEVLNTSGDNRISYLKFLLPNVSFVTGVKLQIYGYTSGSATVGTAAYSVADTNWTETGVNWNNRPAVGAALSSTNINKTAATYLLDVTSFVKSELMAGRQCISLALTNPTSSSRYVIINSKESGANVPQLILENTNLPPTVAITAPGNNSLFYTPGTILISANATDPDGTITNVDFFANGAKIGTATNAPFNFIWTNAPNGVYSVTAVATDNSGDPASSGPITIKVDALPSVILTSPTNSSQLLDSALILLSVNASDVDGSVARVDFYAGPNLVASSTTPPFASTWITSMPGTYTITAKATDNLGGTTTSSGSTIQVYPDFGTLRYAARLGYWKFETTNWFGEAGQQPIFFTNIQNIALNSSNHVLQIDSTNAACLKYQTVENNHSPNIDVQTGSIVFRFKPNWNSSAAGGTGPGSMGQLISVGQWTSNAVYGCWNLCVSSNGNQLLFITQTNGTGVTNLTGPVSLTSNVWYQIALTYSATNSSLYINAAQIGTNGLGVAYYPNAWTRITNGFAIGSNRSGSEQMHGQVDDLETFNYQLTASQIAARPDSDSDGMPDSWELANGLNPYDASAVNGPNGDPDGDGLSNYEEYLLGTDPQTSNASQIGKGLIQIHTPLK